MASELETVVKPVPTLEETWDAVQKLWSEAEANPDDERLQQRAGLVRDILKAHREYCERLAGALGLDPDTDFDELKARGLALFIESGGRHRTVQRVFDGMGFRYWQTPEWEAFKATPAGVEYERQRTAAILAVRR